jgi:hypothetical protein
MEAGAVEEITEPKADIEGETIDSASEEPAPEHTDTGDIEAGAVEEVTEPKADVEGETADSASEEPAPENTDSF